MREKKESVREREVKMNFSGSEKCREGERTKTKILKLGLTFILYYYCCALGAVTAVVVEAVLKLCSAAASLRVGREGRMRPGKIKRENCYVYVLCVCCVCTWAHCDCAAKAGSSIFYIVTPLRHC